MSISKLKALAVVAALLAAPTSWAALTNYSEDFEGLNMADPAALTNAGWLVFGNVFDGGGGFKFGYGPFGAPNGGAAFSAIVSGEGGAPQGSQQFSVYNDYNCCGAGTTNEGHFNGTDLVQSLVFREQTIGTGDLGKIAQWSFDAKAGNIAGSTQARAYVQVLDSVGGTFALLGQATFDTTSIGTLWSGGQASLLIDNAWDGQLLQFGFLSEASNFEGSGVFYDNVNLNIVPIPAAVWLFASGLGLLGWMRRRAAA